MTRFFSRRATLSDIHITPELMEAVSRGDLQPHVALEAPVGAICCICARFVWTGSMLGRRRRAPARWTRPRCSEYCLSSSNGTRRNRRRRRNRRSATCATSSALPQKQRLSKRQRSRERFRGLVLAHRLLNEAKCRLPGQPQETHDLAEAAEQVLLRTPGSPGYFDALARATVYRANALRAAGKVREADERMATARSLIRHQDVTATLVYAEVDLIEGSLRRINAASRRPRICSALGGSFRARRRKERSGATAAISPMDGRCCGRCGSPARSHSRRGDLRRRRRHSFRSAQGSSTR